MENHIKKYSGWRPKMNWPLHIAIIGAGLSGIYLASLLQRRGISYQLFESSQRVGGRIYTVNGFDLGPTWYWPNEHRHMDQLVHTLNIATLAQWQTGTFLYQTSRETPAQQFRDPQGYGNAKRLLSGADSLVQKLLAELNPATIMRGHHLAQINQCNEGIELAFRTQSQIEHSVARQVVLAVPPRLIAQTVQLNPVLNSQLSTAMAATPTWMAGQAKVVFEFAQPFWREQGLSGNAMANYPGAVLGEIFDASSDTEFALGAFLSLSAQLRAQWQTDLTALMLDQLIRLFGAQAAQPKSVLFKDWYADALLSVVADALPVTEHPDYGHPWLQLDHWNDRLFFCGSETAQYHGGYMEGALNAAKRVYDSLMITSQ
ncbi:MAG: amine oxidase [Chitinophagaceae bacterium]|nr:MAG: amine oxidase [Chitinophagaceae bacterium]